jgi:hypothetical protein
MGREVRRVPKDWEHPTSDGITCIPLHEGPFEQALEDAKKYPDEEWVPERSGYMPTWADEERTHYQMYEDTSEGTPISPVMESPEELARWLVDNEASAFAGDTASYDSWLAVAKGGWAPSAIGIVGQGLINGVDGVDGAAALSKDKS